MAAPIRKFCALARKASLVQTGKGIGGVLFKRFAGTANAPQLNTEPYHLYSGLIIERRPVVTAEFTDIEKRYQQLQSTLELEHSSHSKHELRHKSDIDLASRRLREDVDEKETTTLTAVDLEDIWTEEGSKHTLASRTTEADKTGNKQTHHRHLDKCVYLLVKQSFWSDSSPYWVFPQAITPDGESTRQTTDRILAGLSSSLSVRHVGNAPATFLKLTYPKNSINSEYPQLGAKIFLHKAYVSEGNLTELTSQSMYEDFCWVTADEVRQYVRWKYWKAVKPVLHEY